MHMAKTNGLIDQVADKELDAGVLKRLADIKHGHTMTTLEQLLCEMLSEESAAANDETVL